MTLRPLAILVDDESAILEELVWHLEQHGWECISATDGAKGSQLWKANINRLELFVTDIRMPGIQGQSLIKEITAIRKTTRPALFIMTAYDDVTREDAHTIGADAIFQKPFRVRELVAAAEHFKRVAQQYVREKERQENLVHTTISKVTQ